MLPSAGDSVLQGSGALDKDRRFWRIHRNGIYDTGCGITLCGCRAYWQHQHAAYDPEISDFGAAGIGSRDIQSAAYLSAGWRTDPAINFCACKESSLRVQ